MTRFENIIWSIACILMFFVCGKLDDLIESEKFAALVWYAYAIIFVFGYIARGAYCESDRYKSKIKIKRLKEIKSQLNIINSAK